MDFLKQTWFLYAVAAAVCAGSINIFAKIGMKGLDADLSTALRSVVQAMFVVAFCAVAGTFSGLSAIHGRRLAMIMIVLSGVAGGLSWIFGFRALQLAEISKVAPIDKLSMPLGILLAVLLLGERPSSLNWMGIALIAAGVYLAAHPRSKPIVEQPAIVRARAADAEPAGLMTKAPESADVPPQ